MKYFQLFDNRKIKEISKEVFERGGSKRGKGFLFFLVCNGVIQVRTGLDTPIALVDFDGLSVEDDRIEDDDVGEGYMRSMQRMALRDDGDTLHDLFCEIAALK